MGDDRDVVFGQVCAVLARTFAIDAANIEPGTSADMVEGWDSLTHLILLTGIERRLNITLPREAAYGARTAGDLSAICRETLGQRHQDG